VAAALQWRIIPLIRDPERYPGNGPLAVIGWCGMRGAVTLAAALALPLATDAGSGFPARNVIVFLSFCVTVVTLVGQGLTLPALVRAVEVPADPRGPQEEAYAWIRAMEAGLARLEELHEEPWVDPSVVQRMRDTFDLRIAQYAARKTGEPDQRAEKRVRAGRKLRHELLEAERNAVVELRRTGEISDAVERNVFRELDLEDARLGGG
jgi:CPA1 family monovalent cation:H+ antiporter